MQVLPDKFSTDLELLSELRGGRPATIQERQERGDLDTVSEHLDSAVDLSRKIDRSRSL